MTLKTIVAAAFMSVAALHGAKAEEYVLRLHQFLPMTDSVPREGLIPWAQAVQEQSGGRLKVEYYPSMQLGGSPASLFDQAREGVVDLVWTVLGYTPGRFPKSEVFEMPFMVSDAQATSRAFQTFVEENAADEFRDVKLIAVHTHGPGILHTRTPVSGLEDVDGMTIRGGSRVISAMLDDLGADAVSMPVPDVPVALVGGVIDGATIPWQVSLALRTSEIVSHHTEFVGSRGLYTQTFAFVMNRDSYARLPEDLRAVIDANSGVEWAGRFGAANDADDMVAREMALERGNTIISLDDEETARWREAAEATISRWVDEADAQGHDGRALLERARALVGMESDNHVIP